MSQSNAGKITANKERMKRILLTLLVAIVLSSAVSGCRTARGAGEDMEKAGQKIQDKADEHTPPP